jgi:HlyD family secretion protein
VGVAFFSLFALLQPSNPEVLLTDLKIAEVREGVFIAEFSAPASLRLSDYSAISAAHGGVVSEMFGSAGDRLDEGQAILVLANPELEQQLIEAEAALASEENQFVSIENQLLSQRESAEHELKMFEADLVSERDELAALEQLIDIGAVARLQYERQRNKVMTLGVRLSGMKDRNRELHTRIDGLRAGARNALDQRRRVVELLRVKVEGLVIRAPHGGDLVSLAEGLREGLTVSSGALLAEVSKDSKLEARANVPASRAAELSVGMSATLSDNSSVEVPARIVRIAPQVRRDEVEVVLALEGQQPRSFRSGLSISATIHTKSFPNSLYVERPNSLGTESRADVWVLQRDQLEKRSVQVSHRTSEVMAVTAGLKLGDKVVLNPSSDWLSHDFVDVLEE